MAFRLTTFAGVTLPPYNWVADLGTPRTINPIVQTVNGFIDFVGTRRHIECAQEFEVDAEPDPASVAATIRALKTLVGRTGYLVRVNTDGTGSLQRYCRLIWVGFLPKASQHGITNKLTLRFWSNEPFWRSSAQTSHGPQALTSGTTNWTITIGGEEDVLDAVLTIASTGTITALDITHSKTENGETVISRFTYTANLTTGQSLVISCGPYTVTKAGADAYANFALHSTHNEVYWLRLPAGSQTITIVRTGGSGNATLTYYPQYQ